MKIPINSVPMMYDPTKVRQLFYKLLRGRVHRAWKLAVHFSVAVTYVYSFSIKFSPVGNVENHECDQIRRNFVICLLLIGTDLTFLQK
jgi:hypothetical protein